MMVLLFHVLLSHLPGFGLLALHLLLQARFLLTEEAETSSVSNVSERQATERNIIFTIFQLFICEGLRACCFFQ